MRFYSNLYLIELIQLICSKLIGMSSDDEIDDCVPVLYWFLLNSKSLNREFWVHPYNKRRRMNITLLLDELRNFEDKFFEYTRMTASSFDYLLHLIEPKIQKRDSNFRKCITPAEKLLVTLR